MSRSFAAAWPGTCAECDGPIEPGQSVFFTGMARRGGDLRHMVCPEGGSELKAGESACPRCWLVHGGECDR